MEDLERYRQWFHVTASAVDNYIEVRILGFWTADVVEAFERALRDAHRAIDRAGKALDGRKVLIDVRDAPVQSRDIVTALQGTAGRQDMDACRTAVVVGAMLQKYQAQSIGADSSRKTFHDLAEAKAWLSMADAKPRP